MNGPAVKRFAQTKRELTQLVNPPGAHAALTHPHTVGNRFCSRVTPRASEGQMLSLVVDFRMYVLGGLTCVRGVSLGLSVMSPQRLDYLILDSGGTPSNWSFTRTYGIPPALPVSPNRGKVFTYPSLA